MFADEKIFHHVRVVNKYIYIFFRIQTKIRTTEKENSRLNRLIGPYRQTLEKYEAETRFMSSKSDSDIVKKFSKLLDQQSTKLKMKQITKLRSDIVQLRKVNLERISWQIFQYFD